MDIKSRLYLAAGIIAVCASGCGGCGGSGAAGIGSTSGSTSGNTTGGSNTSGGSGFATISAFPSNVSLSMINDNNLMVGSETTTPNSQGASFAFAVQQPVGGQVSALPGPGEQGAENGDTTSASCLNNSGLVGGFQISAQNGDTPAFWNSASLQTLSFPAGNPSDYVVNWINSLNQIVGANQTLGLFAGTGFYWPSPSAQPKQLSPAGFWPAMMNDSGLAVGWIESNSATEFFKIDLNTSTTATDLGFGVPISVRGSVTPFSGDNLGIVVNDSGTIVLRSGASQNLIQISPSGAKTQIGTEALPEAMNAQGDVVGQTVTNGHAFLYTPSKGLVDMNKFVKPSSGLTLADAFLINKNGFVIASTSSGGGVLVELPSGAF